MLLTPLIKNYNVYIILGLVGIKLLRNIILRPYLDKINNIRAIINEFTVVYILIICLLSINIGIVN